MSMRALVILDNFIPHTLQYCDSSRQVMQVIYHAFHAHKAAYHVGYLHREISYKNVMVTGKKPNLVGILSDWDLAVRWRGDTGEEGNLKAPDIRYRFRTGTWYYMSVALLRTPEKPHSLQDDLESFFWLVLHLSLRWFDPRDLQGDGDNSLPVHSVLSGFGEVTEDMPGRISGGDRKKLLISDNYRLGHKWSFHENDPLTNWVKSFRRELKAYFDLYFGESEPTKEELDKGLAGLGMRDHTSMEKHLKDALAKEGWSPHKVEVVLTSKTSGRSKRPLPSALASSSASEAPVIKKQGSTTTGPSRSNSQSGA